MTSTALALKQSSHLIAAPIGSLDAYIERVTSLPVLSREEEIQLAEQFRNDGDLEAARALVLSHLRFVVTWVTACRWATSSRKATSA
jgi:RNA polymerase sigma-32 factor